VTHGHLNYLYIYSKSLKSSLYEQPTYPANAGLGFSCSIRAVYFVILHMIFKIPGQDVSVRFFERVGTTDSQYDIFDVGLQQEDGSIDSLVVGGSFSYAKSLARKADENKAQKATDDKKTVVVTKETVEAVAKAVTKEEPVAA
jgi:hypothetical protein